MQSAEIQHLPVGRDLPEEMIEPLLQLRVKNDVILEDKHLAQTQATGLANDFEVTE
jgi:hypothetical protein